MKNKILVIIIILIVIFISGLGIYVFNNKEGKTIKEHYFIKSEIKNIKNVEGNDIDYKEKYSNYIVKEELLSINYNFFNDEKSITGKIYIGEDKKLYITDSNGNQIYKVSDVKFKTMYLKDYLYKDKLFVFLISDDNSVYNAMLYENDITKIRLYKYSIEDKIVNFVDIKFKHDIFELAIPLFALTADNKIIDINSGILYVETIIGLYNNLYVYYDKTMTDMYGKIIEDSEGNPYKIKYVFDVYGENELIKEDNQFIIITEADELIYFNLEMTETYEFDKKVKDVKFDQNYPYISGKLEITFEDDYKVDLTAKCNQYYCINKFAE